ncbi:sensor histidine kinase [Tenacibaculum sp. UWU-22]|uniref:sensor histidine kinase n=1 Tax=Tenacibaculum sp. UWU-22 TaxID=3234187 RepID=UPI0034DB597B
MSKKIFILIVALMSISLIGIIAVQIYWIKDAIKNKQQQFENDVTIALAGTSEKIAEREENEAYQQYSKFFETNIYRTNAEIKNFLFQQIDTTSKEKFSFGTTILEENYKIPTGFYDNDSAVVKRITGKQDFLRIKAIGGKELSKNISENRFSVYKNYSNFEREEMAEIFRQRKQIYPIDKRISNRELNNTLREELAKRNIYQEFKYGVYENGLATPLKSGYYTVKSEGSFSYPLFADNEGNSHYKLFVTFPNEKEHLLSDMMWILVVSIFFIFIIIVAFSSSLYQLIRQKKISEIKTDFINNMTHEFKTPIATINLALDAIKNPKIISDQEKIKQYVKMIREENKRMHGQVENVLRISKLEKKQLDIAKQAVDVNQIVKDAIEHISLLISSKEGSVQTHLNALSTEVLGNQFHLTNVIVNMLENAIKYSDSAPKIDIFTESTNKFFILKIQDDGIGMSKQAQKYAFDKFYREHKGNIHNVKGHGLGLAYVKEIIENHHGIVYVESEKGKGSTFTVKLPLI